MSQYATLKEFNVQMLRDATEKGGNPPDMFPQKCTLKICSMPDSLPVYRNNKQIGYATSGCWSPILKKYLALAHLRSDHAAVGTRVSMEVTVEHQRRQAAAVVVQPRFFDPERKRSCP